MINLQKSQPAPVCLLNEKQKVNGDYKCGNVLPRMSTDFHNKCYLCEEKEIGTINVEHFKPHRGNKDLKFDWDNLFYACGHCNNTKLADPRFDEILNCLDATPIITDVIEFEINSFPKELPKIKPLSTDNKVLNTCLLLENVYVGKTEIKKLESANLRDKLIKEVNEFSKDLHAYYYTEGITEEEKSDLKRIIKRKVSKASSFSAFKIWIIKRNSVMLEDFRDLLPL